MGNVVFYVGKGQFDYKSFTCEGLPNGRFAYYVSSITVSVCLMSVRLMVVWLIKSVRLINRGVWLGQIRGKHGPQG